MAKRFIYISAGMLFLMLAAPSVAQPPGLVFGWKTFLAPHNGEQMSWALLENGDTYHKFGLFDLADVSPTFAGNFWQGGPQPSSPIAHWEIRVASDIVHYIVVILSNGDMYVRSTQLSLGFVFTVSPPDYSGNFWGNAPVAATPTTWGAIKQKAKE